MLSDVELASLAARLMGEASREPHDAKRVLAAFMDSVRRLVGVHGAGVHYAPRGGDVQTEGTSREVRELTADAAAWHEGPDHEARTAGRSLIDLDVTGPLAHVRWPRWVPRARALGAGRVTALPLSGPHGPVGALVLVSGPGRSLDERALTLARSHTDMTADALFLAREAQQGRALVAQLQHALNSRVVIEQAKGMLSVRFGIPVDEAFARLRSYARSHQRKIAEIARDITEGRGEHPTL